MAIRAQETKRKTVSFILLLLISIVWMIPVVWGLSTSLKSTTRIAQNPGSFIPDFDFSNYKKLFTGDRYHVLQWMGNSFIIAVAHTAIYLVIASLAAYAFGCLKFVLRDTIFWFLLSTTMIPAVINFVPLVSMMISLNWFQSWFALIIPGLGGVFGLFLMRQFFKAVPNELLESAKIEGASKMGIFFKIVLPLSKSAVLVAGLFAFMGSWNDYLWPQVMLFGVPERYTLPVGLGTIISADNYEPGLSMSAAMLSIIPVIIVYAFVQRWIIEGVAHTGSTI